MLGCCSCCVFCVAVPNVAATVGSQGHSPVDMQFIALVLLRLCRVKAAVTTIGEAMLAVLRVEHTWPVASCRRMQT